MLLSTLSIGLPTARFACYTPKRQFNYHPQDKNYVPNLLVNRLKELPVKFLENPDTQCPKFREKYKNFLEDRLKIYNRILNEIPDMDPVIKNHYFTEPINDHHREIYRLRNKIKLLSDPNYVLYPWPGNGWWRW